MKRTIFVGLLLLCVLAASAQIQRNLLGFTLGTTTKSVVYNKYKTYKSFSKDEYGNYTVSDIVFAGEKWDYVSFEFTNNKLEAVQFVMAEPFSSKNEINTAREKFNSMLWEKYSEYINVISDSDSKVFCDNKTDLIFIYRIIDYNACISIRYSDRELFDQSSQKEMDEL